MLKFEWNMSLIPVYVVELFVVEVDVVVIQGVVEGVVDWVVISTVAVDRQLK